MTRIRGIYAKQSQLRLQDQFPFNRPIEEWKEQTTTEMSWWIKRNVPFIKYCLKVKQTQTKRGTTDIRKFFSAGTTQTEYRTDTIRRRKTKSKEVKSRKLEEFGFSTKKRTYTEHLQIRRIRRRMEFYNELGRPPDTA